jgi:FtsH-binding integral membrane protein
MSIDAADRRPARTRGQPASHPTAAAGVRARAVFGEVMGLVALTLGCVALGAYIGRDLGGGAGIAFFVGSLACVVGLHLASAGGRRLLSTTLMFGLGLLLGLAMGPVVSAYADADPAALWQAAGVTGAFVAALGAVGYATRRDLSRWARSLFWALIGLLVVGVVAIFVSIPHGNLVFAIAGLVIFGGYTIFDFNRLRRAGIESAVPIAASIFLDIFNVFLLVLQLLGGERD